MTITFVILAVTIVMFVWGRWQADLVAVGSLLALYLTGVVSIGEAFSGFANTTVVLIATLFGNRMGGGKFNIFTIGFAGHCSAGRPA